ncbi:MAG TPA: carboxymuconolactone decarboxylase family protein [Nevskia sp.]|nr:carboxymuconolactone decarboxylase family protein [Nevskia sp.]
MERRYDYAKASPATFKAVYALQGAVNTCGLDHVLLELVKMRASQINGCAFCLAMHARDARKLGIADDKLHLLPAWREAPALYNPRERAALAWTEALTLITEGHAPDEVYQQVRAQFSEKETADLSAAIATINVWNRLNCAARTPPELERAAAEGA